MLAQQHTFYSRLLILDKFHLVFAGQQPSKGVSIHLHSATASAAPPPTEAAKQHIVNRLQLHLDHSRQAAPASGEGSTRAATWKLRASPAGELHALCRGHRQLATDAAAQVCMRWVRAAARLGHVVMSLANSQYWFCRCAESCRHNVVCIRVFAFSLEHVVTCPLAEAQFPFNMEGDPGVQHAAEHAGHVQSVTFSCASDLVTMKRQGSSL